MTRPDVYDFTVTVDPTHDLDGYGAWENFGGLSLEDAYIKFCEHPLNYQEDFMFMGKRAYRFYFPVIDRYMREIEGPEYQFDDLTWIIGCGIEIQFSAASGELDAIRDQSLALCSYVLEQVHRLPDENFLSWPKSKLVQTWELARDRTSAK